MSDDFSIEVLWEEMKKELEKEGYTKRKPILGAVPLSHFGAGGGKSAYADIKRL